MKTGYMLALQNAHDGVSDAEMLRNELRIAGQAEECGFDVIWCAEHHFDNYSIAPDNFQLLTWLAARTQSIQLGTAAVILPWNDPLRLTEKASVLDAVSEGRFVLGLGRGLARMEYEAFGIDMNEARDRFDESARMVVDALETGFIEGTGPYYPQKRTEIRPRPLDSFKDKLYSVAMSPDSITAAAQLGARMMFFIQFALERHMPLLESYRQQYLQNHGTGALPPLAIDFVVCDRDTDRAEEMTRTHLSAYYLSLLKHYELAEGYHAEIKGYESYGAAAQLIKKLGLEGAVEDYISHQVWGTPQQIIDKLEVRRQVIGEFEWNMVMSFGGIPFDVVEANTRLISQEVLPELKTWGEDHGQAVRQSA